MEDVIANSPLIGRTATATTDIDKAPHVVRGDCIVMKNLTQDGKRFELALFRATEDLAAGYVAQSWAAIASGTHLSATEEDDLDACLDDCYYIGWFSKRQLIAFLQGAAWRAFLQGAPEVQRAQVVVEPEPDEEAPEELPPNAARMVAVANMPVISGGQCVMVSG